MSQGIIFDIKELAIHDGPGIRVTVFFKGCPLKCIWCHNPEGISTVPQIMKSHQNCDKCGKCEQHCDHPECEGFSICTKICPKGLIHISGETLDSTELANRLKKYTPIFKSSGGITVSGGEPLMQPDFLLDLLRELKIEPYPIHTAVETSGYGDSDIFKKVVKLSDLIMFDIKLINTDKHIKYTRTDNKLILNNLDILKASFSHFIIRMPIIPGVNDTREHFIEVAELLSDVKDRMMIEVLPYNRLTGVKYQALDLKYQPQFDSDVDICYYTEEFDKFGITHLIL